MRHPADKIGILSPLVFVFVVAALLLVLGASASAQDEAATADTPSIDTVVTAVPPAPPTEVVAKDKPNDHGHGLIVTWTPSADDMGGRNNVMSYQVLRTPRFEGPFADTMPEASMPDAQLFSSAVYGEAYWRLIPDAYDTIGPAPSGATTLPNVGGRDRAANDFLPDDVPFQYVVQAISTEGAVAASRLSAPMSASGQFFHFGKTWVFCGALLFTALVLGFIQVAKSGRELYIRPLAGISAVDEAIGRATEMGRPILYVLGLGAADEIATIASFTILARVARKVADYRTELLVPTYDPIVMTIAQETVKQAYLDAGRPEDYKEDMVYFVTQNQFAYVAAVNGTMLRRQTATNFYLGVFYAESLILAETGSLAGSIQISGTDRVTQIPFFVVACDYTLIGEELYAASAYLGREPVLLGTLKAQDWAKASFLILLFAGTGAALVGWEWFVSLFHLAL